MKRTGIISGLSERDGFTEGMRIELDGDEQHPPLPWSWRRVGGWALLGFALGYAAFVIAMAVLCAVALTGCGGSVDEADGLQAQAWVVNAAQADPLTSQRHWCCDVIVDGRPALTCGILFRSGVSWATCYCSGIVDTAAGTCEGTKPYTPGTMCTQSELVCW
jgi:uncharacterized protein YceK